MAAVVAGVPSPAHAAPPDMWGFAYVEDPTVAPWTNLNPAYQATSPATPNVQGGKTGTGRFTVKFLGLGIGMVGNVHVTAVGKGNYCETVRWDTNGVDEIVDVACFRPGGVPQDTRFAVMWTNNSVVVPTTVSFASVQWIAGVGLKQFYNSTGAGVTITQVGTGAYSVRFQKVGTGHSQITGTVQVTAQDFAAQPRRCKVSGWDDAGTDMVANVYCFDAGSTLVDSGFTASFQRQRPILSADGPPKYFGYVWTPLSLPPSASQTNFNYPAGGYGLNTVTVSGSVTSVRFPLLAFALTHAQVTAFGNDANYCTLGRLWVASGSDLVVTAACFAPSGAPAVEEAFVAATNNV